MKTDNEIIAEFMGIRVFDKYEEVQAIPIEQLTQWALVSQLQYHNSWSFLMPVVEKIYKMNPRAFRITLENGPISPLAELHIYDPIAEVYDKVVKFIKWHNEQK